MTKLEEILGPASPDLLNSDYVVAVARQEGKIHWISIDRENLALDLKKWRATFVEAGYRPPKNSWNLQKSIGWISILKLSSRDFQMGRRFFISDCAY